MYVSERGILKKVKDEGAGFLTSVIEHLHASTSFSFFLILNVFCVVCLPYGEEGDNWKTSVKKKYRCFRAT